MAWAGLGRVGFGWARLGCVGLGWVGLGWGLVAALHCDALRCAADALRCASRSVLGSIRVAVRCGAVRVVRCTPLQCIALHCTALQCTAIRCSVMTCLAFVFQAKDLLELLLGGESLPEPEVDIGGFLKVSA